MSTVTSDAKSVVISSGTTHQFKVRATYTITTTDTKVTFTVTKFEIAVDKNYKPNMDGSMAIDGTTVNFDWKQIVSDGSSSWTWGTIWSGSKSKSWNRAAGSSSTKTFTGYAYPMVQGTSYKASVSVSISVPALPTYTLTYKANGGTGSDVTQTKTHGTAVTLKAASTFSRTGYTFSKWNTASGGTGTSYSAGASYTANAKATLYAIWSINTWTVSYNANGGSGAPASQTKTYGQALPLSSAKPTRTGYTFDSWNTAADGSGTKYAAGATYTANAAAILYAQWTLNTYAVTYDANGGTAAPAAQTKVYGTNLKLSSTKPARSGYAFLGWATSVGGDVAYAAGATYTANAALALHAVWTPVISASFGELERYSDAACTVQDDMGGYLRAAVSWECAVSVTASIATPAGLTLVGGSSQASAASGSLAAVFSGVSEQLAYTVAASFSTGSSSAAGGCKAASASLQKASPGAIYPLDFYRGSGVGVRAPAPEHGLAVGGGGTWLIDGFTRLPVIRYSGVASYTGDWPVSPCIVIDTADNGIYYCTND